MSTAVLIAVVWTCLSVALGLAIGRALAVADAELEDVDLLADQPVDVLSDAEIRRRCARIEAELRHPSGREWTA